jgi:hypothetical protein
VKTADVPFMKESPVAETKQDLTNVEGKPDNRADLDAAEKQAKAEKAESKSKKPAGPLGRASESSDPAVHKLMADRQTAAMNGDKDGAEAASDELRKLGFE